MKKVLTLLFLQVCFSNAFCQFEVSFEKDTLEYERFVDKDIIVYIPMEINEATSTNNITIGVNEHASTRGSYSFTTIHREIFSGTKQIEFPITILRGKKINSPSYISIQVDYNYQDLNKNKIVVLRVVDNVEKDKVDKKESTTIWNNITYLNAANFDFSDNLTGSYLGKLNIFAPDIKNQPIGLNAGIMRIKFNYKDSSNSTVYLENKLIHPLDSIKQGTKYLRQLNEYTTTRSNTVWSFFVQPLFRLVSWPWHKAKVSNSTSSKQKGRSLWPNSAAPNGIYLHLHGELLVNKTSVTTNIQNLQQDTSLIDTTKRLSYLAYQRNPLIFDQTYLNGYFGVGITINIDPFGNGNSRFFFQPTIGVTTNYPNWASQDISSTVVNVIPTRSGTTIQHYQAIKSSGFYLIRAEFAQMLSNNSQIVVGTDIRGLLPRYNPLYAAYIGLNINLDAVAKIVSDKDKK